MPTPIKAVRYANLSAKQIKTLLLEMPAYLELMDETDDQRQYRESHPAFNEAIGAW